MNTIWLAVACSIAVFGVLAENNAPSSREGDGEILTDDSKYTFLFVPNISAIDLSQIFTPAPELTTLVPPDSTTSAPVTDVDTGTRNETKAKVNHSHLTHVVSESPIGYSVPCGIGSRKFMHKADLAEDRIVGGSNASPGEFPWLASLQLIVSKKRARHICGGAIISPHWVITAAHCINGLDPAIISIVVGDYDLYRVEGHEQRVSVSRIVTRNFVKANFTNDIALLQLAKPLKFDSKWISPVCLPAPDQKFPVGSFATVAGWGRLSENGALPHILQKATSPILPRKKCFEFYQEAGYDSFLGPCQLCSGREDGKVDSCQGDSGGPLVCRLDDSRYYLCGVVSYGVGCARPRFPGMYTQITCFSNWIQRILYDTNDVLDNTPDKVDIGRI